VFKFHVLRTACLIFVLVKVLVWCIEGRFMKLVLPQQAAVFGYCAG